MLKAICEFEQNTHHINCFRVYNWDKNTNIGSAQTNVY